MLIINLACLSLSLLILLLLKITFMASANQPEIRAQEDFRCLNSLKLMKHCILENSKLL